MQSSKDATYCQAFNRCWRNAVSGERIQRSVPHLLHTQSIRDFLTCWPPALRLLLFLLVMRVLRANRVLVRHSGCLVYHLEGISRSWTGSIRWLVSLW